MRVLRGEDSVCSVTLFRNLPHIMVFAIFVQLRCHVVEQVFL